MRSTSTSSWTRSPAKSSSRPIFAAALDGDPEARAFFAGLSYSNKRRIVEPIADAKAPETRQRRIEKSVAGLHDHRV